MKHVTVQFEKADKNSHFPLNHLTVFTWEEGQQRRITWFTLPVGETSYVCMSDGTVLKIREDGSIKAVSVGEESSVGDYEEFRNEEDLMSSTIKVTGFINWVASSNVEPIKIK